MKIFLNGKWYDSEKTPIIIKLSHIERIHITQMMPDSKYYGSFPEKLSEKICNEIIAKANEKDCEK